MARSAGWSNRAKLPASAGPTDAIPQRPVKRAVTKRARAMAATCRRQMSAAIHPDQADQDGELDGVPAEIAVLEAVGVRSGVVEKRRDGVQERGEGKRQERDARSPRDRRRASITGRPSRRGVRTHVGSGRAYRN